MVRRIKTSAVVQNAIRVFLAVFLAAMAMSSAAATISDPLQGQTFTQLIEQVTDYAIQLVVPFSAIMVLIAGFLYMTGGGNPEKIKTAHRVLIWALVGTAIVLISKGAILIIESILGV